MLAELHCHTHYSRGTKIHYDGVNSPEEVVKQAKVLGLGAIALTDHNTIDGWQKARNLGRKYGVVIIPGEEISSSDGHILALGISELVKKGMSVEETLDDIRSQGGFSISAHPFDIKNEGLREKCIKCNAVEVFNALNLERISNNIALDFARKHGLICVAGSDAHSVECIGNSKLEIDDGNADDLISALKKRRFSIASHQYTTVNDIVALSMKRLQISYKYVTDYINMHYWWPKKILSKKFLTLANKSPGNIDYLFKGVGYLSLGTAVIYSVSKNIFKQP